MKTYQPYQGVMTPRVTIANALIHHYPSIFIVVLSLVLIALPVSGASTSTPPSTDQNALLVKAKIGIQVYDKQRHISLARTRERLQAGDMIRVYVHTEKSGFIYVVHFDGTRANLLHVSEQKINSSTLVLPSAQAWYELDGKSDMEKLTVVCAPSPIDALAAMETSPLNCGDWHALETSLKDRSRLLVTDDTPTSFTIAGNIRGVNTRKADDAPSLAPDALIKQLSVSSGRGLIVKSYTFKVE